MVMDILLPPYAPAPVSPHPTRGDTVWLASEPDWLKNDTNPEPSPRFRHYAGDKFEWTGTDWVMHLPRLVSPAPQADGMREALMILREMRDLTFSVSGKDAQQVEDYFTRRASDVIAALSQSSTAPGLVVAVKWHEECAAGHRKLAEPRTDAGYRHTTIAETHDYSAHMLRSLSASDRREEGK